MDTANFDIDAIRPTGTELARYTISSGERVLMGWQRSDGIEVTDRPTEGRARAYVVDRGISCFEHLTGFLGDYLDQARRLDACPMSGEAITEILAATDIDSVGPLAGVEV